MAVVNIKSSSITSRDASPRALSNASLAKSKLMEALGVCAVGVADNTGSQYRFCQIPSNARINRVLLYQTILDGGGGTSAHGIALYDTTENGAAVVDATFFASAVASSTGVVNGTDVTHEDADDTALANMEKMIWQQLGLSADPCKMYDVVAVSTGDADIAGTMALKVRYVI